MAHASAADEQAEIAPTTPPHVPQFSALLGSGKYSDLTLTCGSRSWKVHKGVLCLQSDFFAKACDGDFKVSFARPTRPGLLLTRLQEAHTNTIDLSEDSEFTVAAMVNFMYHGKYDAAQILPSEDYESGVAMLLHVRVVGLAQKYFVEPLQKYAGDLASKLMKKWDGASLIFAESVFASYTGTEDIAFGTKLRERAVEVVMDNGLLLFGPGNDHLAQTRQILLDETPGFVEDWARAMSYCSDTLSTANTSLEAVNDVLNADNAKLNDRYTNTKDAYDKYKTVAEDNRQKHLKLVKKYNDLANRYSDLAAYTKDKFSMPDKPTAPSCGTSGPAPDCYKCPNCELLFFRAMSWTNGYHHPCFENGWCGKLGKGGIYRSHTGWQEHLVRKA